MAPTPESSPFLHPPFPARGTPSSDLAQLLVLFGKVWPRLALPSFLLLCLPGRCRVPHGPWGHGVCRCSRPMVEGQGGARGKEAERWVARAFSAPSCTPGHTPGIVSGAGGPGRHQADIVWVGKGRVSAKQNKTKHPKPKAEVLANRVSGATESARQTRPEARGLGLPPRPPRSLPAPGNLGALGQTDSSRC